MPVVFGGKMARAGRPRRHARRAPHPRKRSSGTANKWVSWLGGAWREWFAEWGTNSDLDARAAGGGSALAFAEELKALNFQAEFAEFDGGMNEVWRPDRRRAGGGVRR